MDELQFRKALIKLRAEAKKQGEYISKEQVSRSFLPLDIKKEQLNLVYNYLTEEKVTLVDDDEEIPKSEINSAVFDEKLSLRPEDSEYLKMYIEELNDITVYSKEERLVQLKKVLENRNLATELLPSLYIHEVVDVARLYSGQGVPMEDLIGEGNVGILLGIKMLDCCESEEEIEEFMMKMIMDSMESLCLENSTLEDEDIFMLEKLNDLNDKIKELYEDLGRKITVEELAAELDFSQEEINKLLDLASDTIDCVIRE